MTAADPPDESLLRRYVRGELPPADAEIVERWVADHPEAVETLDKLAHSDTLADAVRDQAAAPPVDPGLVQQVCDRAAGPDPLATAPAPAGDTTASETVPPPSGWLPPDEPLGHLGGYQLVRILGRGGMGTVYEALDPRLSRRVALKVMRPELAEREQNRQRFLREGRAAAAVEHDNIVPVYHVAEDGGVPFLAMPLLSGETLEDRLKRGPVPLPELLAIARQVADGLSAAHVGGLIHRDIKPSNIWLETRPGERGASAPCCRARILDFGLARSAREDGQLTGTGTIMGTPAYMAPEQARDSGKVDHRADLFSLGGVLYRMATGKPAFAGSDPYTLLTSIATTTPPAANKVNPAVPRRLSDLIGRLLAKDPAGRPATAADVGRELAAIADPGQPVRRPRRARLAVAAVLLLALAGGAMLYGGQVVRVVTNKGELIVTVDDPDVEVVVKQNGVEIRDTAKGRERRYVLTAGDGEVEFVDPETGVTAATKKFRITRGGKDAVTVTLAELAAAKPAGGQPGRLTADQRKAVEWVLASGGEVGVVQDGRGVSVSRRAAVPLPPEPFRVAGVYLWGNHFTSPLDDAAVANLEPLPDTIIEFIIGNIAVSDAGLGRVVRQPWARNLETITLHQVGVTDAGLAHLADCRRLNWVLLNALPVTDRGVEHLRTLPLTNLGLVDLPGVTGTFLAADGRWRQATNLRTSGLGLRDEALVHLRGWLKLESLLLDGSPVTDAGLEHLAGLKSLRALNLTQTKTTAAGVKKLAAALPNCKIDSDHGTFGPAGSVVPAGDQPPAKDAYPGDLVVFETFDDPKATRLPGGDRDGYRSAIRDGIYTLEEPKAKAGFGPLEAVGPAAPAVAVVARVRAIGQAWFVTFRGQAGPDRQAWLGFRVNPDGSWHLVRNRATRTGTEWAAEVVYPPVARSAGPDPELAVGKWVTLVVRSAGSDTAVWANGRLLTAARTDPDPGLPPAPYAVGIGTRREEGDPLARLDLDFLAAWRLPPPLSADQKNAVYALAKAGVVVNAHSPSRPGTTVDADPAFDWDRVTQIYLWARPERNPLEDPAVWAALRAFPPEAWHPTNRHVAVVGRVTDDQFKALLETAAVRPVQAFALKDAPLSDAALGALDKNNPRELEVSGCPKVTDAGLLHLHRLRGLERVTLKKTGVTAAGVKKLAAALPKCNIESDHGTFGPSGSGPALLTAAQRKALDWVLAVGGAVVLMKDGSQIEVSAGGPTSALPSEPFRVTEVGLGLTKAPIDDAGLVNLAGLPHTVTKIVLHQTEVTDVGLDRLTRQPWYRGVRTVHIFGSSNPRVTDAGLVHLTRAPDLRQISLIRLRVTGEGLGRLRALPITVLQLEELPAFTDAGLEHLAEWSALRSLSLAKTQVTAAGVKKLAAALPQCDILSDVGTFGPSGSAVPAGDQPPAKDAYPGELLIHETFDAPTVAWPPVAPAGLRYAVEHGVFRTDVPAAGKRADYNQWFGSPAADVAFATRARAPGAFLYASFAFRRTPTGETWLQVDVYPSGAWKLFRKSEDPPPGARNRRAEVLAESPKPDPELAAGNWVALAGRADAAGYELWLNGQSVARGKLAGFAGTPVDTLKAVEVGMSTEAAGAARLDIDYMAVWKLPPSAAPPPRDSFPGEVIAYETYDEAKPVPPAALAKRGTPSGVENGAKVFHFVQLGEGNLAFAPFGGPAADVAFVARVRGTNAVPFAEFRIRKTPAVWSKLEFTVAADGGWRLAWPVWDRKDGDWKLREPTRVLATSDAPDPELAVGKWVSLAARSHGPAVEVWANGRRLTRVDVVDPPDAGLPPAGEAVNLGGRVVPGGDAKFEIDHAAVWKLPAPPKLTAEEEGLLFKINAHRARAGAPPLTANATLVTAARKHADDMARWRNLTHESEDKPPAERVKAAGYAAGALGENVAQGKAAADAVGAWLESDGHKKNLLGKEYTDVGLGVTRSASGDVYVAAVFAAPGKK